MNNSTNNNTLLRLFLGIAASAGVGVLMAMQVDIISTPLSILVASLTAVTGLVSAKLLVAASPRRERPSRLGTAALILFLALYVVVGKIFWSSASILVLLAYLLTGLVFLWLVFTARAETTLLSAIGIGGFCSGFLGVLIVALYKSPFAFLMNQISSPSESTTIYTSIGLMCAISGIFAAITSRLSGWGLVETRSQESWGFTNDGRLYVRKD